MTDYGVIAGAIDLYVHAWPDLFDRVCDDWQLAEDSKAAGLTAVVHRNHHSPTAERCAVVREHTGFDVLGAILLNGTVGGVNPYAAELALRMGAVWVGFPSVSAAAYRARVGEFASSDLRDLLLLGSSDLSLVDESGSISSDAHEVLALASQHGVVVGLGYSTFDETKKLIAAGAAHSVPAMVLTNVTTTMALSLSQIDDLMDSPEVFVEVTTHSFDSSVAAHGRSGQSAGVDGALAAIEVIRRYGAERCVVSSDGGIVGAPPPRDLLAAGCSMLLEGGLTERELDLLIRENPRRLVGAKLGD